MSLASLAQPMTVSVMTLEGPNQTTKRTTTKITQTIIQPNSVRLKWWLKQCLIIETAYSQQLEMFYVTKLIFYWVGNVKILSYHRNKCMSMKLFTKCNFKVSIKVMLILSPLQHHKNVPIFFGKSFATPRIVYIYTDCGQ